MALAAVALALVAGTAVACSSGSSDSGKQAGDAGTTAPAKGTATTLPKVHPERDVSIVSCGASPTIRVKNGTKTSATYLVVVSIKDKGAKATKAVGRVERLAAGASKDVVVKPLKKVSGGATCTVGQVVRTGL